MRPLEGLRVVELSQTLAGVFAGVLLADFGAEVLTIEPPSGHPLRKIPPLYNGHSLVWTVEARNKRSIVLDLAQSEGRRLLEELLCRTDILIEDLGPGRLEELGGGEARRHNPGLVILRLSPFGQSGPYRDRPGNDRIAQAMGGLTYVTGTPELPPVSCGVAYASYLAGAMGALFSLIALYWRDVKGGKGQDIDLALYEAILRISEYTISGYDRLGIVRERTGNTLPQSVAPGDCYLTKDGHWVVLTTVSDAIFTRLVKAMGREDLASDPRFSTGPKRVEHGKIIEDIVRDWVRGLTLEQVTHLLNQAQVPVNAVYDVSMVFNDPHIQARQDIVEVPSLTGEAFKMAEVVPRLSKTPGRIDWAGPPLGYHTDHLFSIIRERPRQREDSGREPPAKALDGICILEPATMGAGPFGPTLLAEFGAEVIKIEIPGQGEAVRRIPPLVKGQSLFWADLHRNKRAISLDLRKPAGQELFKRLAQRADVIVENFRPGTFERWGLGYEELSKVNPQLILVRVSGYGQYGPYSKQPGFDRIGLAFSGLMHLTGYPEGPPLRVGLAACDWLTGVFNAFGTMLALYWRDARGGGQGQVIDAALYESVLRIQEATIPLYDKLKVVAQRQGNRHPSAVPGDNYLTSDGRWIAIFITDDDSFKNLIRAIGREELAREARFKDLELRRRNQEELEEMVRGWVATRTGEEVIRIMREFGVPATLVYNAADIMKDPQIAARNNIIEVDIPGIGRTKTIGVIPRLSLTPGTVEWAGPAFAQDNKAIYEDWLGLTPEEVNRLRQEEVI